MPETMTIDPKSVGEIKNKAKAAWATGSYNDIATFIPPAANHLVRMAGIQSGDKVLDVATGTGVTAITARRTGAEVVALDLTPELLEVAKEQERVAGVSGIEWKEGDAEALPFPDNAFDVVVSSYGHMFAPRPEVTLAEMMRVLKPDGRLAFLTHEKGNVAERFFAATAKHVPPPANAPPSPFLWGDQEVIKARLGANVREVRSENGRTLFPMLSPAHFWQHFSAKYGPTMKAIEALGNDPTKVQALAADFIEAVTPYWVDGNVEMAYVITRAIKK